MRVTVEDGRVVRTQGDPDHPPTNGALCTTVSRYAERTCRSDRVLHPPRHGWLDGDYIADHVQHGEGGWPDLRARALQRPPQRVAQVRGITSDTMVRVFNQRGSIVCRAEVTARARPGGVNGLGVWWRKFGVDGKNVNPLTHQRLTDSGGGPSFYDGLADVEAA